MSRNWSVNNEKHEDLNEVIARCEPFQAIRNALLRFRVSIGQKDVQFNARAYVEIMNLDSRPVLHIVDEANSFHGARFLNEVSKDPVWDAIPICRSTVYTGLPDNITVDEGSKSRKLFAELAAIHRAEIKKCEVLSQHRHDIGERYRKPRVLPINVVCKFVGPVQLCRRIF